MSKIQGTFPGCFKSYDTSDFPLDSMQNTSENIVYIF